MENETRCGCAWISKNVEETRGKGGSPVGQFSPQRSTSPPPLDRPPLTTRDPNPVPRGSAAAAAEARSAALLAAAVVPRIDEQQQLRAAGAEAEAAAVQGRAQGRAST